MQFSIIELTKPLSNDKNVSSKQFENINSIDIGFIPKLEKKYKTFEEFTNETHLNFDYKTKTIRIVINSQIPNSHLNCFFYHVIQHLKIDNLFIEFQSVEYCRVCWKFLLRSLHSVKYLKFTYIKSNNNNNYHDNNNNTIIYDKTKNLSITLLDLLDDFHVLEILEVDTNDGEIFDLSSMLDIRIRPYLCMKELRITTIQGLFCAAFKIPILFPNLEILEFTYKHGVYYGLYSLKSLIRSLSQLKTIRLILFDDNQNNVDQVISTLNTTLDVSDQIYIKY